MASLVWTSIFIFLICEIVFTIILVIPVPRTVRNWICRKVFKWKLEDHFKMPLIGVGVGLGFALLDCISSLKYLYEIEREDGGHDYMSIHEREKEYKTERNLYLCGFAFTLLFVIGRLLDLMEEHVQLEDELVECQKSTKGKDKKQSECTADAGGTVVVDSSTDDKGGKQIEMTTLRKRK